MDLDNLLADLQNHQFQYPRLVYTNSSGNGKLHTCVARMKDLSFSESIQFDLPIVFRAESTHHE